MDAALFTSRRAPFLIMPASGSPLTVSEIRQMLRSVGLRCTSCRVAVVQHLSQAEAPLSHADVAQELVPAGFDKSTIYRCLAELAEVGIFLRLDAGDHLWRYEIRSGQPDDGLEHPHFICIDCGEVACLPDVTVNLGGKNRRSVGAITEVLLKGHCDKCR